MRDDDSIELAVDLLLAHAADDDTISNDEACRLCEGTQLLDDDTNIHNWFSLARELLSSARVVSRLLEKMPGAKLCVTVDRYGETRCSADAIIYDDFTAADAHRAAWRIARTDVVDELINYDSRLSPLLAEGVYEEIALIMPDVDEYGDIRSRAIARDLWTWRDEHAYVQNAYDDLARYADIDIAQDEEMPEWAQFVNWGCETLDRIDAQKDIQCALQYGHPDERACLALEYTYDRLGICNGRYPRIVS